MRACWITLWALLAASTLMAQEPPADSAAVPDAPRPLGDERELPWRKTPSAVGPRAGRTPANLPELLAAWGLGKETLQTFAAGQPLRDDEREALHRILFRVPQIGWGLFAKLQRTDLNWDQVAAESSAVAGHAFALRGRVKHVTPVSLPADAARTLDFERYFHVTLQLENSPVMAHVFARHVPQAWQKGGEFDERASLHGVFLKTGESCAGQPTLLFAADRVAWHPDRAETVSDFTSDRQWLANQNMDFGLFDGLAGRERSRLEGADFACFYELLGATQKANANDFVSRTTLSPKIADLLRGSGAKHGQLCTFQGNARRVVKVAVENDDVRGRFGFDHYFEIDLFVGMEGQIAMDAGAPNNTKERPVFENSYPVTVCLTQLPPGLEVADECNWPVRVHAVYYTIWAYRSQFMDQFGDNQWQISPLFVGGSVELIESEASPHVQYGLAIVLVALGLFATVWVGSRYLFPAKTLAQMRREIEAEQARQRGTAPPNEHPDFSGLP